MIKQRFNPHAHSTASDGELTIEQIDTIARLTDTKQIVTDHNTVDAHRRFSSDRIGGGIEVKTKNGVDILVCGPRNKIIGLFDDHLQSLVDPQNPIFGEINISPVELVGLAREMDLEVILPHPATAEGTTMLSLKTQEELARHDPLVESNGRMTRRINKTAKQYARQYGLKLIAGGDSHIEGYDQYTTSFNQVKHNEILTPEEMLTKLRQEHKRHKMRVSKPSFRESLATGKQVLAKGGLKMLQMFAKYKGRQLFGTQYY
jgi:predicted metal-dependent phosphoesterase TrpH